MKLAILKGDNYNPWHVEAFQRCAKGVACTVFHTEAEAQAPPEGRNAGKFQEEILHRDDKAGPLLPRWGNRFAARFRGRTPRILPFHHRLKNFELVQTWELFNDWSDEAVEARLRYGIPLAVAVWDNVPFNMERDPARRALKSRVAVNADRFIVHTERSRRTLDIEGVDPEKVVKIAPGVDTKRFAPGKASRAEFGVADDDFVILLAGWYIPRKGIDFLLLALRELLRDPALSVQRRVRLLVAGAGPGKERVARLAERLKVREACVFTGQLSYAQLPGAFRAADAFVLPGIGEPEWQEHYGMLLIEALSCGVPVVSAQSGTAAELAEDAALLCPPRDFVSLYEALRELMLDKARGAALGKKGRQLAQRRYRIEDHAKAMKKVYRDMLKKR